MYNYTFVKELFEDMLESVENMKKATNFSWRVFEGQGGNN